MVLAHQLTIGAFDGRNIVRRLHAEDVTGIFKRRATLRLLPAAAGRLLLLTAAKVRAALHHAQELIELHAGNAQLFSNHIQDVPFIRMQRAIREGGLDLNFQKHPNLIETPETDATELPHFFTQRVVI